VPSLPGARYNLSSATQIISKEQPMARNLKTYTSAEVTDQLKDHPGWTLGSDGQLHADFTFKNFMQVMLFTNAVAHLAQVMDHHPDLFIHGYKHLSISLMTHSEGGITENDFRLVAQIDTLPRYPQP
jgi:4a-hydroxytetrahydrobiopterin dehydratase